MARRPAPPPSQLLLYLRGEGVAPNGEPELKRILSYGAGADSFALLCAAYEYYLLYGRPLLDYLVFADTGDPERKFPGEWPETYAHIIRVAQPLAAAAGIPFKWITGDEYPVRDARSLYEWIVARNMMPSVHPKRRLCTIVAKIERVEAFTADLWPAPTRIETWIGMESGEESRLLNDPYTKGGGDPRRVKRYPLMDFGLCRCRLTAYIRRMGLPVPPKSACMFCPANSKGDFQRLRDEHPARFDQAVFIEENAKLSRSGVRLRLAGNQKKNEDLRDWVERDYQARPPACKVCGAEQREEKLVGAGGDPLPPGHGPVLPPWSREYDVRDFVTGQVLRVLGHAWAAGLPADADPTVPASLGAPAPSDALTSAVHYTDVAGARRTAVLRPTSASVWAGRPMLLVGDDGLLHASSVLG